MLSRLFSTNNTFFKELLANQRQRVTLESKLNCTRAFGFAVTAVLFLAIGNVATFIHGIDFLVSGAGHYVCLTKSALLPGAVVKVMFDRVCYSLLSSLASFLTTACAFKSQPNS
jgi:hypothetical protein